MITYRFCSEVLNMSVTFPVRILGWITNLQGYSGGRYIEIADDTGVILAKSELIEININVGDYIDCEINFDFNTDKYLVTKLSSLGVSRIPWEIRYAGDRINITYRESYDSILMKQNLIAISDAKKLISNYLSDLGFINLDLERELFNLYGKKDMLIRPSISSVCPLYEEIPPSLERIFDFGKAPINQGVSSNFDFQGTWLYLGLANCDKLGDVKDIISQLLKELAAKFEKKIYFHDVKYGDNFLYPKSFHEFSIHGKTKHGIIIEIFSRYENENENERDIDLLFSSKIGNLISERYTVDWGILDDKKQFQFPDFLGEVQGRIKYYSGFRKSGVSHYCLCPVNNFELVQRILAGTRNSSELIFTWVTQVPYFKSTETLILPRFHQFVSPKPDSIEILSTNLDHAQADLIAISSNYQNVGIIFKRISSWETYKYISGFVDRFDGGNLLEAVEYDINQNINGYCGVEIQIERLISLLIGEDDISKMFIVP